MLDTLTFVNVDTGASIVMGDTTEYDYIIPQGGMNFGNVSASHSTFTFPGQVGSTISFTGAEERDFSVVGWIVGKTLKEIERKKNKLSSFFNIFQTIEIRSSGYSLFGKPDSSVQYGRVYKENNDAMCKFSVSIFCNRPLFEQTRASEDNLAILTPSFHFPMIIKPGVKNGGVIFGKRKKELFSTIVNDGANEIGIVVEFNALGTVHNPEIVFVEQNKYFRIKKTLEAGEQIRISTIKGERRIEGRVGQLEEYGSYLDYWDETSTWLVLPVGVTTVAFKTKNNGVEDDTYKNLEVKIEYRKCLFNLDGE